MTPIQVSEPKDFFISYNHADERWAVWIAWILENAGHSVVVQAWDFRPGSNFGLEMHNAVRTCARTIAVVSPAFLRSTFTAPEWAAAFAQDPSGASVKLVPVRVEACDVDGLLGQVVRIDLVGKDPVVAERALLGGLDLGRAKPVSAPPYPGHPAASTSPEGAGDSVRPPQTNPVDLHWQPLEAPLVNTWTDYNEYGQPKQADSNTPGGITGIGYGWLGVKQRATVVAGFTLMGVRLHNPVTGLFTSVDPIYAGNTTAYAYPTDPINASDLDGQWGRYRWNWGRGWRSSRRFVRRTWRRAACYASGLACTGARHGTYTASISGPFGGASFSYSRYGGRSRFYGGISYNHSRGRRLRHWSRTGASLSWSPGYPNSRKKFSYGGQGCYRYCIGAQNGYRGRGTYRGWTPSIGVGFRHWSIAFVELSIVPA